MIIKTVRIGPMENNCYLITDEKTGNIAVIDPSFPTSILTDEIFKIKDKVKLILLTHRHYDHVLGAAKVQEMTGAKTAIHNLDKGGLTDPEISLTLSTGGVSPSGQTPVTPDILLNDGDILTLGETQIKIIHTPGHTEGGVCFLIGDCLFSGDTLFCGNIGRCDLPTGNYDEMKNSLKKIENLPVVNIFPGHSQKTTLQAEKQNNPYLNGKNL